MRIRFFRVVLIVLSACALMAWNLVPIVGAAPPDPVQRGASAAHRPVCGPVPASLARCHSHVRTDVGPLAAPVGYSPADLTSAYKLPASLSGGATPTVAIVDAFDDPNAEADLAVYRSTFG